MSMIRLAWAYLAARPLLTLLNVAMLALGVGTLVLLLQFTTQAEERFARDARPVDLVVGAKGSPLQLILSSVLQADVPTGNIRYAEARALAANPMIAAATPVSIGDTFRGFRIVGSDASYLALYGAKPAQGRVFAQPMEAVLGAEVARRTGVGTGAELVGTHGLGATGSAHAGHAYRVVGVLAPTATVIDRLIVTPLESVWEVHDAHPEAKPADSGAADPREITALLVKYRTPIAAALLPRQVNATTSMQAAAPAYEIARLMNLVGVGVDVLRLFAGVLMVTAALSMFVALSSALQERRYDLALLRTLGARPITLFALVAAEGVTLVIVGVILGLVLGHAAAGVLGSWVARSNAWQLSGFEWQPAEGWVALAVLAAGAATCLIPAFQAYRRDPAILLKR
jgi:putative ABC transport system permease protein